MREPNGLMEAAKDAEARGHRICRSRVVGRVAEEAAESVATNRFVLLVNKQGQTRLVQSYEYLTLDKRIALEGEIVRKCLARNDQQEEDIVFLTQDRKDEQRCSYQTPQVRGQRQVIIFDDQEGPRLLRKLELLL